MERVRCRWTIVDDYFKFIVLTTAMSAMNGEGGGGGGYHSNQSNFVLCSQHRVSFLMRYLILKASYTKICFTYSIS